MKLRMFYCRNYRTWILLLFGIFILYFMIFWLCNLDGIDDSQSTTNFEELMQSTKLEMDARLAKVEDFCKKYRLGRYKWKNGTNDLHMKEPPTPLYSYFFWNTKHNIGWCPVYKAGSTSWLYNMMILAGYSEQDIRNSTKHLSVLAREVYGDAEPKPDVVEKSFKLLVVRHPFERLVSAYIDKLSNSTIGREHGTLHYYEKYGKKIVSKYRTDHSIRKIEPTWEEFVAYLIDTDLLGHSDDHWLPAYYSCTPCIIQYDVIAKVESYNRDQIYTIWKGGFEHLLQVRWNHKSSADRKDLSTNYFKRLTKSQIEQLYQKYWLDFNIFDYDYKSYLSLGREL